MNFALRFPAFALILAASTPSTAPAATQQIEGVGLNGQAEVTIVPGNRLDVRVERDDRRETRVTYETGSIRIRGCMASCNSRALPKIVVTMPRVSAIAVDKGGAIRVGAGFRPVANLALAVDHGGLIDAMPVSASRVAAAVDHGGVIRTRVRDNLAASVEGPGQILYAGSPSIASSTRNGGRIQQIAR